MQHIIVEHIMVVSDLHIKSLTTNVCCPPMFVTNQYGYHTLVISVSLSDSIVIFNHFVSINYVTLNKLTLLLLLMFEVSFEYDVKQIYQDRFEEKNNSSFKATS